MKKSVCIEAVYTELPFYERIAAAAADGFSHVEFWHWIDKDLNAIKEETEKNGVGIAGFLGGDTVHSMIRPEHKASYLEFLERSVEAAKLIGAEGLIIQSNALNRDGSVYERCQDLSETMKICSMFDTLKEVADMGEKSGIVMMLEPLNIRYDHAGYFMGNAQMAADFIGVLGSPYVRLLYDVYHMQINEGDICNSLEKYQDMIAEVHIADVPGRHEPGTGEVCYPRVVKKLQELGYDGLVGCELFPLASSAEAVKAFMSVF